ncbi:MAG TPA: hypothetical protein DDZ51_18600 [Planctomycetaceae bacterium]|nr:hypothetical protein [Planctomycetaceae bacterium]
MPFVIPGTDQTCHRREYDTRMTTHDHPTKPYPGFPLYQQGNGYWAKKIRGKTHYFGRIEDGWEAAEDLYNRQRDDLYAGRVPRESDDILTVELLLNAYLDSAKTRVANDEIKQTSWDDAQKTAQIFWRFIGKSRSVESLRVLDFEEFRGHLLGRFGITTAAGHIARTKAMLKWAFDVELIDTQVRTGPNFKRPSAAHFRRHRASKPKQFYTAAEIRLLHAAASPQMKAMILLGINAAMGNRDCGELEFRHIDLESGWITYARSKTGIARRAQLWPETIEALQAVIAKRRQPADKSLRQRVLLTRCGQPWAKEESRDSPIAKEWTKLMAKTKLPTGRGFYALRHTFRTVADESGDQVAVRHIMGHADTSIDGQYRESIADARLAKVAEYVRSWFNQ